MGLISANMGADTGEVGEVEPVSSLITRPPISGSTLPLESTPLVDSYEVTSPRVAVSARILSIKLSVGVMQSLERGEKGDMMGVLFSEPEQSLKLRTELKGYKVSGYLLYLYKGMLLKLSLRDYEGVM